jgi:hypothetical protein
MSDVSIRIAVCAFFVGVATAQAAPEDAFHQAAFGATGLKEGSACFARSYDDQHLSRHKGQRIRDVAIRLIIRTENGARRLEHGLSTHLVGSKQLYWSGGECHEFKGLVAHCYVEGDGGTVDLTLSEDGKSMTARFDTFRIWRPQDAADESDVTIDKSSVDKVARLDRAPESACKHAAQ